MERPQGEQQVRQGGVLAQAESRAGLAKGEEVVARDKVDAPKAKKRLLDINVSDYGSDGETESKMDELTKF